MGDLRRDPIVGRWVIMETDHPNTPADYECETHTQKGGLCPFCYGNESMTPTEIDSCRDLNTQANTPGWQVRVVPNKFPALKIEGDIDRRGIGIYDLSNGIGAHEVLIDTPYHDKDIPDLVDEEVEKIILMCCRRSLDLTKDKRFKYIMIFKNYGPAAGASLEHPHTQLIALPMVPKNALEEIKGARAYFEFRERCIFCDMIRQELEDKERIVSQNAHFLSFCPFVSRFPFEIVVYNRKYAEAEKPLLIVSIIFSVVWIVAAFLTARHGIEITPFYFSTSPDFIFMLAANTGAVIMPFMLFYQVSATAEKGTGKKNVWAVRFETLTGAIFSELIMVAIAISAIGISAHSLDFTSPKILSLSLASVAGHFAPYVFGIGLITASFIALIVISLGSCWGVRQRVSV